MVLMNKAPASSLPSNSQILHLRLYKIFRSLLYIPLLTQYFEISALQKWSRVCPYFLLPNILFCFFINHRYRRLSWIFFAPFVLFYLTCCTLAPIKFQQTARFYTFLLLHSIELYMHKHTHTHIHTHHNLIIQLSVIGHSDGFHALVFVLGIAMCNICGCVDISL